MRSHDIQDKMSNVNLSHGQNVMNELLSGKTNLGAWMKFSINFNEISSKYCILGVVEMKQVSNGRNIQQNRYVFTKFQVLAINRRNAQ